MLWYSATTVQHVLACNRAELPYPEHGVVTQLPPGQSQLAWRSQWASEPRSFLPSVSLTPGRFWQSESCLRRPQLWSNRLNPEGCSIGKGMVLGDFSCRILL